MDVNLDQNYTDSRADEYSVDYRFKFYSHEAQAQYWLSYNRDFGITQHRQRTPSLSIIKFCLSRTVIITTRQRTHVVLSTSTGGYTVKPHINHCIMRYQSVTFFTCYLHTH